MKEEGVEFVAGHQPSIGLEPTDRAFDDPPLTVAAQWSAILGSGSDAAFAVGTDQLDAARGQTLPQGVTLDVFSDVIFIAGVLKHSNVDPFCCVLLQVLLQFCSTAGLRSTYSAYWCRREWIWLRVRQH